MPNAIALGAGDGTVVHDRALFELLTFPELEAIVAHELAHLERRDGLVVLLAITLVRAVVGAALFAAFPLLLVVTGAAKGLAWSGGAPTAWLETRPGRARLAAERVVVGLTFGATLLVRAHPRRREFAADARAADLTGNPLALAHALRRIETASAPTTARRTQAEPSVQRRVAALLATHPTTEDRVARLVERADRRPPDASRIEGR